MLDIPSFTVKDNFGTIFYFHGAKVNKELEPEIGCRQTADHVISKAGIDNLLSMGEMRALLELGLQGIEKRDLSNIDHESVEKAREFLLGCMFMSYTGAVIQGERQPMFGERTRDILYVSHSDSDRIHATYLYRALPDGKSYSGTQGTQIILPMPGRVVPTADGMYSPFGLPFETDQGGAPGANLKLWEVIGQKVCSTLGVSRIHPIRHPVDQLYTAFMATDMTDAAELMRHNATFAVSHSIEKYLNVMRGFDTEFFGFTNGDPICVSLGSANGPECGIGYRMVERK